MSCLGIHQYVVAPRHVALSAIGSRRRNVRLARRPSVGVGGGDKSVVGKEMTRWKVSGAMAVAPASQHYCVVDAGGRKGGDSATAYYNYSFSADEPSDMGSKVLDADGVSVYMTASALEAKRAEPDAPEPPPAPVMEVEVQEDEGMEETVVVSPAEVKVPNMANCVVNAFGSDAYQYMFTDDEPTAEVGAPPFEVAGVSVYMTASALEAKRAEPDAPEPPPAPVMEVEVQEDEGMEETVVVSPAEVKVPNMANCVVNAFGSDAYQYMFTDDEPTAEVGAPPFEVAGVSVYMTASALEAKRAEPDAPELPVTPLPPTPEPAAEVVEDMTMDTGFATASAAVSMSLMSHCLVSSTGGDDLPATTYSFSEDKPAGVNSPFLETASVSLYNVNADADSIVEEEEEEEFLDAQEDFEEEVEDRTEYLAQLSRALRTVDAANIAFPTVAQEVVEPAPVEVEPVAPVEEVEDRTEYLAQLSRALRTVDAANIAFPTVAQEVVEPAPVEVEPVAPVEAEAPSMPTAMPVISSPAANMSTLEGCGKSGMAVFERGSGITAWQGLEIGYELDLVLELQPELVAADIISQPAENVGSGPVRSGAALFANGVGVASWQEAQLDAPIIPSTQPQQVTPSEDLAAAVASAMTAAMAAQKATSMSPAPPAETVASASTSPSVSADPTGAIAPDIKETRVASGQKKSMDLDMKVQIGIWIATVAFVVYRYAFSPA